MPTSELINSRGKLHSLLLSQFGFVFRQVGRHNRQMLLSGKRVGKAPHLHLGHVGFFSPWSALDQLPLLDASELVHELVN